MRFLFFTDDHKRGTSPENRTDNFPATLVRKLKELVEIAQEYEVDYILHGGDFFDVPSPHNTHQPMPIFAKLYSPCSNLLKTCFLGNCRNRYNRSAPSPEQS